MTAEEMRQRMEALLRELGELNGLAQRSAEQEARIDAILPEVNELGQRAERQGQIDRVLGLAGPAPDRQPSGRRGGLVPAEGADPAAQPEGGQGPDRRSPGRRFVESDAYRGALRDSKGRSDPVAFDGLIAPYGYGGRVPAEPAEPRAAGGADGQRALVHTGTLPAEMVPPTVIPGVQRGLERPLVMRDVLSAGRTTSDAIVFMQETAFVDNAAEVAEATTLTGVGLTGGVKPESGLSFAQQTVPVVTIAHWIPITRQTLQDAAQMESYVNERLLTGLARREDRQILAGDGVGPNMRGLLSTSGVQELDGAYFTANPVRDAGTANENFNRLRRAMRLIRYVGEALPTFVVANPADLEEFDTATNGDRDYLFGGPAAGFRRTYWGLPAVESMAVAEGQLLVGDGTAASVFDRMQAQIFTTDSHADLFVRNILVILAEERLALAVFRPAAFALVTLA